MDSLLPDLEMEISEERSEMVQMNLRVAWKLVKLMKSVRSA